MSVSFRIAVLVSGSGTNLQAVIDQLHGRDGLAVVAVASNNGQARALERVAGLDVECGLFERSAFPDRRARDTAMADWLCAQEVDLVVLAGYMELIDDLLLERFANRVINVHPSLLPAFPGPRPIEGQLAYGAKVGGVTVHFVDSGVDTGPVILQEAAELPYTRSQEETLNRLHEIEHRLLPRAIRLIAAGAVSFDADNPRYVRIKEGAVHE